MNLAINNLSISMKEGKHSKEILAIDQLTHPAGRSLGIFGPSGAGKTTLLHLSDAEMLLDEESEEDHADEHEGHHHGHDVKFTVSGKLEPRGNVWDFAILVPIETVWTLHGMFYGHKPVEEFHDLVVGPPFDPAYISPAPAVVFGFARKHLATASKIRFQYSGNKGLEVFAPAEILLDVYKYLGDGKKLLLVVAFGSIVIVLISIFFSIIASLDSYAPKLMLLRVLGAPRFFVFFTVWLKSVIMTACGAILGLLGGLVVAKLMATYLSSSTYLLLRPTLGLSEFSVIVALLLAGILGATIPAFLVTRRSPAEVLRGN